MGYMKRTRGRPKKQETEIVDKEEGKNSSNSNVPEQLFISKLDPVVDENIHHNEESKKSERLRSRSRKSEVSKKKEDRDFIYFPVKSSNKQKRGRANDTDSPLHRHSKKPAVNEEKVTTEKNNKNIIEKSKILRKILLDEETGPVNRSEGENKKTKNLSKSEDDNEKVNKPPELEVAGDVNIDARRKDIASGNTILGSAKRKKSSERKSLWNDESPRTPKKRSKLLAEESFDSSIFDDVLNYEGSDDLMSFEASDLTVENKTNNTKDDKKSIEKDLENVSDRKVKVVEDPNLRTPKKSTGIVREIKNRSSTRKYTPKSRNVNEPTTSGIITSPLTRAMKTSIRGAEDIILMGLPLTPRRRLQFDHINHARLAKHACTLWSSEQRRRYQQLYPSISGLKLEDKLRTGWECLSDKDTQKYYLRAKKATRDLNTDKVAPSESKSKLPNAAFNKMSEEDQNNYLAEKLVKFQMALSTQDYNEFLRLFKLALKNNFEKCCEDTDRELLSRQLLNMMLRRKETDVEKSVVSGHARKQRQFNSEYRAFLEKLVNDRVKIPNDDKENKSDGLTHVLDAITSVEEKPLKLEGNARKNSKNIDKIAVFLSDSVERKENYIFVIGNEKVCVPKMRNSLFESRCLLDLAIQPKLSVLSVDDINDVTNSTEIQSQRQKTVEIIEESLLSDSIFTVAHNLEIGGQLTVDVVANSLTDALVTHEVINEVLETETQFTNFVTGDHIYCK